MHFAHLISLCFQSQPSPSKQVAHVPVVAFASHVQLARPLREPTCALGAKHWFAASLCWLGSVRACGVHSCAFPNFNQKRACAQYVLCAHTRFPPEDSVDMV